ncbi:MAG: glycosyl hydrolase [Solirubrobacteraceae bacterium]|nr:glycosyl hydrolase [Patulibacter sp.]
MRHLLTTALVAAAALLAAILPAALLAPAASATAFGIGDQSPSMFTDSRFTALKKVRIVRYIAPWDVQNDPEQRDLADAWIAEAKAKGYLIHFTFNYSSRTPERLPSVAAYTKATSAFVLRHRLDVETWGVFNEANRGTVAGRFATPGPVRAAQYFTAFRTTICRGCKIVGLDVLDGQTIAPTLAYVKAFKRAVGPVQPKIWGFHNYSDTNRASTERTGAFLKAVKGQVWITETGGLYRLGNSFKPNEARQATATRQVFAIARKYPRLTRVYLYNWFGPGVDRPDDVFDAGLISGSGKARPAYQVVKAFLGG